MARTRLRGLEIGGIQIGLEVPETCDWEWPEGPIADYTCLPRSPEVHVGLRVGDVGSHDLGGERYAMGAWVFEVARRGEDWMLGLSRGGRRELLALFDSEFRAGEIVHSQDAARRRDFPLRSPLDEWIVLHRTVASGGLCVSATAIADDGCARLRLGALETQPANRWITPTTTLLGRNTLLIREDAGRLRVFRTPWNDSIDARLGARSSVSEFCVYEANEQPFRELLDPAEAAELLVTHAIVPLCDEGLLDRVLCNAQRIGDAARVLRIGEPAQSDAPIAWRSAQLQSAFASPRSAY